MFIYRPGMSAEEVRDAARLREEAYGEALHSLIGALAAVGDLATLARITGEPVDIEELDRLVSGRLDPARALTDFRSLARSARGALGFRALAFDLDTLSPKYADQVECPACRADAADDGAETMTIADLLTLAGQHRCARRAADAKAS